MSNDVEKNVSDHGIQNQLTVAYTPQQNGVAERFWAEALATSVYVRNRLISRGLPLNVTPQHLWMGSAPNLEHMSALGHDAGMRCRVIR